MKRIITSLVWLWSLSFVLLPIGALAQTSAPTSPRSSSAQKTHRVLSPENIYTKQVNTAIPDNGYTGTIGSMTCSTIDTTGLVPVNSKVSKVFLLMNVSHTYVGDLTVKFVGPDGTTLTILNRPGSTVADTGTDAPFGNSANWNGAITFEDPGTTSAESMGSTLTSAQTICDDDGKCSYAPAPDTATNPPANFAAFEGKNSSGPWKLCVADSAASDTGTFVSWSLNLSSAVALSASPALTIPDNAYTGGFGGGTQACSTIDTTSTLPAGTIAADPYVSVDLTHNNIGDLTIKLRSPNGSILTILNRPGSNAADTGVDSPTGDTSNWNGPVVFRDGFPNDSAENMGSGIGDNATICINDRRCTYTPAPDTAVTPPTNFASFNGETAVGAWTLCVADSQPTTTGTFNAWTIKFPDALVPSAAGVSVGGRVLTVDRQPIAGAIVRLSDASGGARVAVSNPFGYYMFNDVESGGSYSIGASAKGRRFQTRVVTVDDAIDDLDLLAQP